MKKNPNMTFQGYGRLPLNADTEQEFLANSVFTGEWQNKSRANPNGKRQRIMDKDRWYRICLYLFDENGEPFHSSNVPDQRTGKGSLWQLIKHLVAEVMKEYPEKILDKDCSYAVISVPKRKQQ